VLVKKHGRSPVAFEVAPGKDGVARVRLTAAALRRLARAGRLTLSLRATTRDATPAGTLTTGRLEVTRK
jgi:hypothetical protein